MQRQIRPCLFYKSLICIVCCVVIAISTSQVSAVESRSDSSLSSSGLSDQQFANEVKEYLGAPYRKGGTSKKGFDCSGFARTVYDRLLGIELPHSSGDQFQSPELQKIDTRELQTGDLVFFGSTTKKKKTKRINHVGVYLSDGQFIHASSSEGIIVSSLADKYWKKRFVGSKRHTALSSTGDNNNEYRFEQYLDMPVSEGGLVSYFGRNEFTAYSPALQDLEAVDFDPFAIDNDRSASLGFHKIGYNQTLFDGFDISLSAFHETFDSSAPWPGSESAATLSSSYDLGQTDETAVRHGMTLASDYHPSDWLSFTPSLTYFDHSLAEDQLAVVPKRMLGFSTQLAPQDSGWSLSMLVRYTDGEDISNVANFDNKISSLDLAIKLGIAVTENLQFSIMSKHDKRSLALRATGDSSFDQPASSDVAMMFDFSY
ncbi:MAG: C40 family peptidase [Desulforhopalus sp.]|nr:C40 family peptidase [Desulforhopalus sp.]